MASHPKNNPRILSQEVYSYIASNSNLTVSQVKECFSTYKQMLKELSCSKFITDDLTIAMPRIGYFYFKKHKGRKKGTVYKLPVDFGSKETKTIVLDHDEPTIYRMAFRISKTLNVGLKNFVKENL